jgi:hypothetical protein
MSGEWTWWSAAVKVMEGRCSSTSMDHFVADTSGWRPVSAG